MKRQEIENALNELDILLNNNLSDEKYYQKYLEDNNVVFTLLGYKRVIPHPNLQSNEKLFIPDFLVQNIDDSWSIIEIKRPDTSILKNKERRKEFYSIFRDYVSQCHEYREYFDDVANRNSFNKKNDSAIDKNMVATIIAGRNKGINKAEIKNILFREGARIYLKTYDDIRNHLEYYRKSVWGKFEKLRGFTLGFELIFHKKHDGHNFIFDLGIDPNRNRVSLFVDMKERLIFRVIDHNAHTHLVKLDRNTFGFDFEKPCFLCLDLGVSEEATLISLEINGQYFKDIVLDKIDFDDSYLFDYTRKSYVNLIVGSDIKENEESFFEFGELLLYKRKLSFDEKSQLRHFFWFKNKEMEFPISFGNKGYLRGISVTHKKNGNKSLVQDTHPLRLVSHNNNDNHTIIDASNTIKKTKS